MKTVIIVIFLIAFLGAIIFFNKKRKQPEPIPEPNEPAPLPEEPDDPLPKPDEPESPLPDNPKNQSDIILRTQPHEFDGKGGIEIPATKDNSLVDKKGNEVPFTLRIPLRIDKKVPDTFVFSKSKRNVGAELALMTDSNSDLVFILHNNEDKMDRLRRVIPVSHIPEGIDFILHITSNADKTTNCIEVHLDGRQIPTQYLPESFYGGMKKTEAPYLIGKSGWSNSNEFVGYVGEVIIEKGRICSDREISDDAQEVLGIDQIFVEPGPDGKFHIPVDPNTGMDVTKELDASVFVVPDGTAKKKSEIKFKTGRYWVERTHIPAFQEQGAIDMHFRENLHLDFQGATLFTKAPAATNIHPGDDGVSRRSQVREVHCDGNIIENLKVEGSMNQVKNYNKALAFEHALESKKSKNTIIRNISVENVWGDGYYASYTENLLIENFYAKAINRQCIGFGNGVRRAKVNGLVTELSTRAAFDMEPYEGGLIDQVELLNSSLDTHLAAGGEGYVNNIHIHHNKYIRMILAPSLPEYVRENWLVEDNDYIGGTGTPAAIYQQSWTKNITLRKNNFFIPRDQGRKAIALENCSGTIELDNKYDNPCIIQILGCPEGTEVLIKENYPDNVYVIEIGGEREIIGTNPELLSKLK